MGAATITATGTANSTETTKQPCQVSSDQWQAGAAHNCARVQPVATTAVAFVTRQWATAATTHTHLLQQPVANNNKVQISS